MMTTVLRILKHTDIVTSDKRLAAYVERCTARPGLPARARRAASPTSSWPREASWRSAPRTEHSTAWEQERHAERSPHSCGSTARPRRRPTSTSPSSRTRRSSASRRWRRLPSGPAVRHHVVEFDAAAKIHGLQRRPAFQVHRGHLALRQAATRRRRSTSSGRSSPKAAESRRCGWLKDKYGVSWQIIPTVLGEMLQDKDPEGQARHAGHAADGQDRHRGAAEAPTDSGRLHAPRDPDRLDPPARRAGSAPSRSAATRPRRSSRRWRHPIPRCAAGSSTSRARCAAT